MRLLNVPVQMIPTKEFQHLLQREVGQLGNILLIGNGDQDNAKLDYGSTSWILVDGKACPCVPHRSLSKALHTYPYERSGEYTPNIREDSWKSYWASDRRIQRNPVKSVPRYCMPEDFPIAQK